MRTSACTPAPLRAVRLCAPFVFALAACSGDPVSPDPGKTINPNVVLVLPWMGVPRDTGGGSYDAFEWASDGSIYASGPLIHVRLDPDFRRLGGEVSLMLEGPPGYLTLNRAARRMLMKRSVFAPGPRGVGPLFEVDPATGARRLLRDSTFGVTSARFLEAGPLGGPDRLVYYAIRPAGYLTGPPAGFTPGYRLFDTATGRDSLLVAHEPETEQREYTNGFDLSPDGRRLLYPVHFLGRLPLLVERDLVTGRADTLDFGFERQFLWARYHPTRAGVVVYGNYPLGVQGSSSGDYAEVGVANLTTRERRVLDTNTQAEGRAFEPGYPVSEARSLDIFPVWSPDGRHVLYASAETMGAQRSNYSLYVLKDVF